MDLGKVDLSRKSEHVVVVPIASLNRATLGALAYARSIGGVVYAINIAQEHELMAKLRRRWEELNTDIILITEYSPYRTILTPLIDYIAKIADATKSDEKITVIVPQFMTDEPLGNFLHNHTGFILRETLLKNNKIIVATYPYWLHDENEKK
jgi:hypothetical protein